MSDPLVPRVGGVLSADIAVPEHEREVRFYSRVLTTGETPLWREDLMNNRGAPIVGLGPRSEEYAHLPVQWMPHVQVAASAPESSTGPSWSVAEQDSSMSLPVTSTGGTISASCA